MAHPTHRYAPGVLQGFTCGKPGSIENGGDRKLNDNDFILAPIKRQTVITLSPRLPL
jgi:hypothetical protein